MTLPNDTNRNTYTGDGSTVTFAFAQKFINKADLKVVVTDANNIESLKTLDLDYTVAGAGLEAGGSITMTNAPITGETVIIERDANHTQETDLVTASRYPAQSVEDALDKLTMLTLQNKSKLARAIQAKFHESGNFEIPEKESRKGKIFSFNETTGDIEAVFTKTDLQAVLDSVSTNGSTFQDDQFVAAAGQTNFSLSFTPVTNTSLIVTVDGLVQEPVEDYTVSGSTLTFVVGRTVNQEIGVRNLGTSKGAFTPSAAANIDYEYNGANAVSRKVDTRLDVDNYFSNYNPAGNGSTDDTTKLQNAIDETPVGGRLVIDKPATSYLITTINITSSIEIIGAGFPTMKHNSSSPLFNIQSNDVKVSLLKIDGSSATGISFRIDSTVNRDNVIIEMINADDSNGLIHDSNSTGNLTNINIRNIISTTQRGDGILFRDATDNFKVKDVYISYIGSSAANNGTAFQVNNAVTGSISDITLIGLDTATTAHNGMVLNFLIDFPVSNITIKSFGNRALDLILCSVKMVNICTLDCKDEGVRFSFCADLSISNSSFTQHSSGAASKNGALIESTCTDITLNTCIFKGYTFDGINNAAPRVKILGCHFTDNAQYGIEGVSGSSYLAVGCIFENNTVGDYLAFSNANVINNSILDSGIEEGQWAQLDEININSNTANISFTQGFSVNYRSYILQIENLKVTTNDSALFLRVSQDGGSSYVAGASDYRHGSNYKPDNAGATDFGSTGDSKLLLCQNGTNLGIGTAAGEDGLSGTIWCQNLGSSAVRKLFRWELSLFNANGAVVDIRGSGSMKLNVTAIDALRLVLNTGNISLARTRLFGLR